LIFTLTVPAGESKTIPSADHIYTGGVYHPEFALDSIEKHNKDSIKKNQLSSISKPLPADHLELLIELEKAHVYIEQLNNKIKGILKEDEVARLEQSLEFQKIKIEQNAQLEELNNKIKELENRIKEISNTSNINVIKGGQYEVHDYQFKF
jgi:uncharacterized protein YlxW (UPF0749 family)